MDIWINKFHYKNSFLINFELIIFCNMGIITLAIFSLFAIVLAQDDLYNLVLHPQDRGAACLDGSPPGLYVHQGSGANRNKFMMYFDSGGFCGAGSLSETLQSCYRRSSSSLGTTKNYKPQKSFNKGGLLSPIKQENPVFYDWTKVFVIYCDGSQYLGHRQSTIQYKDANLHFRGSRNVMEQFRYMSSKYDFYNGEAIVITGVSAGGMATYEWSNYLMQNTKKAKIYAIPDSGFFITDYYSEIAQQKLIRDRATSLLSLINTKQELPIPIQKCLQKPGLDIIDCVNAGQYIQFLTAPMLIIQSPYDAWSVQNALGSSCLKNTKPPYSLQSCDDKNRNAIQDYRKQTMAYMSKMKSTRKNIGLWAPACVQHGFTDAPSFTDEHYKVNGQQLAKVVQAFINDPQNPLWLQDMDPWPSNTGCDGKVTKRLRQASRYSMYNEQ